MGQADHSSRVACLSVIKEPHREDQGPLGLPIHGNNNNKNNNNTSIPNWSLG